MRYFEVLADDINFGDRWFLGKPQSSNNESIDARLFRYGCKYQGPPPIYVPVKRNGISVAFTLGPFDCPVINKVVREALIAVTDNGYELFPVDVEGSSDAHWIFNVTRRIKCVDESRSVTEKWLPEDDRPDRMGAYRSIPELYVDSSQVEGDLFRINGWELALIVSDRIRLALSSVDNLGITFLEVT